MAVRVRKEAAHKAPPHNIEAEQAVLGAILIEKDAILKVFEHLTEDGADFYHDAHSRLFRGMVSLYKRGAPIDVLTVTDLFKDGDDLAAVGGIAYIGEIAEVTPTAANISHYARIVREKSVLRRLIATANDIIQRGYEGVESIEDFLAEAESAVFRLSQDKGAKGVVSIRDIVGDTFKMIENLSERKNSITGVPTGFKDLDRLTSGLQDSDLIVLAGRPRMGKTAFCLNLAENVAVDNGVPVLVFSLEMSKVQLVQRLLASRASVDLHKLRSGHLREEDWGRLTTAVGALYEAPIFIDDTPAQTALEMRAKARRWKVEHNVGLVIVDYLQLMRGRRQADNREQEIADISRSLKAMAKELNVPVIALSQLSRMAERREDNIPQLSDLRESGAIEQDADIVMFVYRESVYKPCECPREQCTCGARRKAELIIAKHRNGPEGVVSMTFMHEYTRFVDQAPPGVEQGWVE